MLCLITWPDHKAALPSAFGANDMFNMPSTLRGTAALPAAPADLS